MTTLLHPITPGFGMDIPPNDSVLRPLTMSTAGFPWLSPSTAMQSEKHLPPAGPLEAQYPSTSTMLQPSPYQQPEISSTSTQRSRRSSTRSTKHDENISLERAKHLERNRISANKCRLKKKKEHARMQSLLDTETAKRNALLSEVRILKDELWCLKNMILEHAKCENPHINNQLAKMTQSILASRSTQLHNCPSPAFSTSTWSDKSGVDEAGVSGMTIPDGGKNYCESMFESFMDLETL